MWQLPSLRDEHQACGYGSDDDFEQRPRRPSHRGFGALAGDGPGRPRLSAEEVLEYGVRQNSSGPSGRRVRFLDALVGSGKRLSLAQTRPRTAIERHQVLLSWLGPQKALPLKSDLQLLRESHRFLRTEEDEDGSWEARLARRYYDRLFKEYVICDLAGYKRGHVGFRWRTEAEVVRGRGQFSCGHQRCESRSQLRSFEVDFRYAEAGRDKRALVKVRLCEDCAYKLYYRRLKSARKRKRRSKSEESTKRSSRKGVDVVPTDALSDDGSEASSNESEVPPGKRRKASRGAKSETTEHSEKKPNQEERKLLESLTWRGPDPAARTREEDFDEYFNDLLL